MKAQGQTPRQMRAAIDAKYSRYGPPTRTPHPPR
ncbi:MAG: hypothetical protein HYV08_12390 [Deltaproteobacteria bacterium]|nr:hypothetical protein [Deltaproteobacteria bacterium]